MQSLEPPVVAVVGIDGAGKSTVLNLLGDRFPIGVTLSSMRNHEVADAPLHDLSKALERLREEAHSLNSPRLILTSIFLQMCMFGPTERFFSCAITPDVILADRHPVIDAAVYLPVFQRIIDANEYQTSPLCLRNVLGSKDEQLVTRWLEAQGRRLDETWNIENLSEYLLSLASLRDSTLLEELKAALRASLPRLVVWLDIDVDLALKRLAIRSGLREVHESREHLAKIRDRYQNVLELLPPDVQVLRIAVDEQSPNQVADLIASAIAGMEHHVLTGISAA